MRNVIICVEAALEALLTEAVRYDAVVVNNHGLFPSWVRIVTSDAGYAWQNLNNHQP